ncbi:MAG: hypothetical protein QXR97_07165 [Thermoproteota archaeon]
MDAPYMEDRWIGRETTIKPLERLWSFSIPDDSGVADVSVKNVLAMRGF